MSSLLFGDARGWLASGVSQLLLISLTYSVFDKDI
jgi:hypothetical protein